MANPKDKQKSSIKVKKKKWLTILAPKQFSEAVLGETHVQEPSQAKGKHVTVNLMTLTRDMKKQHVNVTFKIHDVIGDHAKTNLIKYKIIPSAIKRLVRRKRDRIDDSFACITKDGSKVRIKPLVITRSNTKNSVLTALRTKITAYTIKTVSELSYDELMESIVFNKFQKGLKDSLGKIYPVRTCEVKELFVESEKLARKSKIRVVREEEPSPVEDDGDEEQTIKVPKEKEKDEYVEFDSDDKPEVEPVEKDDTHKKRVKKKVVKKVEEPEDNSED